MDHREPLLISLPLKIFQAAPSTGELRESESFGIFFANINDENFKKNSEKNLYLPNLRLFDSCIILFVRATLIGA